MSMIFFRQKLHEVITLPPPPKDDMAEALEVQNISQASLILMNLAKLLIQIKTQDNQT